MVGASLAARRAEPTSCQHPFPSRGFDPFAKPQGNDRNSRDADGRSRRKAAVRHRDGGVAIGWESDVRAGKRLRVPSVQSSGIPALRRSSICLSQNSR